MGAGGYLPPAPEYSRGSLTAALAWHWSALGEAKARKLNLSPERAEQEEAVGDPAHSSLAKNLQRGPATHTAFRPCQGPDFQTFTEILRAGIP